MNEKNIDKNLRDRFSSYRDNSNLEANWEKLIPLLESSRKFRGANNTSLFQKVILVCLVFSNLCLLVLLQRNNKNLEALLEASGKTAISLPSESVKTTKKPEIYTDRYLTPDEGPEQTSKPNRSPQASVIKPTNSEKPLVLNKSNQTLIFKKINLRIPVELSNISALEKNLIISTPDFSPLQPINPQNSLKSLKNKFTPGLILSLPRTQTDIGKTVADFGIGLDIEYELKQDLSLKGGFVYQLLKYKLDDHHESPTLLNKLLASYPVISEDQSIRALHEINTRSNTLLLPLGLRYYLGKFPQTGFHVEAGVYARAFLNQNYEYEFTSEGTRKFEVHRINEKKLSLSGTYLSIGKTLAINKDIISDISLFSQLDYTKQGSEGRKYKIWGIQANFKIPPNR